MHATRFAEHGRGGNFDLSNWQPCLSRSGDASFAWLWTNKEAAGCNPSPRPGPMAYGCLLEALPAGKAMAEVRTLRGTRSVAQRCSISTSTGGTEPSIVFRLYSRASWRSARSGAPNRRRSHRLAPNQVEHRSRGQRASIRFMYNRVLHCRVY